MKTRSEMIDEINKLLGEDITEQFNDKEESSEFGDILIENSKGEQVDVQACLYNWEMHYVIIKYKMAMEY